MSGRKLRRTLSTYSYRSYPLANRCIKRMEGKLLKVLVGSADHQSSSVIGRIKNLVTIPSTQKLFTEDEVSRLTGICLEHLRSLAQTKHIGSLIRAAGAAGAEAGKWLFTNSELMILNVLCPRCDH